MLRWTLAGILAISLSSLGAAFAQQAPPAGPGPDWGGRRGGDRVAGVVASVGVDRFTVKTPDGKEQVVLVSEVTRYREQRQEIQLEDLKPGDHVFVAGHMNSDHQLQAMMVGRATKEQMERFGGEGDRVFGQIVAIEKDQIRVSNRWQGERVVKIDDKTTFMKEGENSSLSDLKKGDRIFAVGKETDGVFVATRIMSGMMRGGRRRGGQQRGVPAGPQGGSPDMPPPPPPE